MSFGRLALRTAVGSLFVGHGTQKLFGWFDGYGLDNTAQMFGGLGLRPAKAHAVAAGVAETAGGAALVLGAYTPLASSALIATMLTAIRTVHIKNGPWAANQGYEYNLVLIGASLALADVGPGSPSVDAARGREWRGPGVAALALGLGIAGAAGAQVVSGMFPEAEPAAPQPESEQAAPQPESEQAAPQPEAEQATPQPEAEQAAPQPEADPQPQAEEATPQPAAEAEADQTAAEPSASPDEGA